MESLTRGCHGDWPLRILTGVEKSLEKEDTFRQSYGPDVTQLRKKKKTCILSQGEKCNEKPVAWGGERDEREEEKKGKSLIGFQG